MSDIQGQSENIEIAFPTTGATQRMKRGGFANVVAEVIRLLEHLLLIPLFLYAWGEALYGEWLIIFSVVAYLSFSDAGMSNFVINRMLQRHATGDIKGYRTTFWSAWYFYRNIVLCLLPVFIIFAAVAPFTRWFNITHAEGIGIRIAALLLGVQVLADHLPGLFSGVYISHGEYYRWKVLVSLWQLTAIGTVGVVLFLKGGLVAVASAYLVSFLIFTVCVYLDVRKRYPQIDLQRRSQYRDKNVAQGFLVSGITFLLIPLANMIKMQGSLLLVGSSLGVVAVAVFGVHRTLTNFIPRFLSIIMPALQHEVTAAYQRQDIHKVQESFRLFMKIVLAISVSAVVFLFFAGADILAMWTAGKIQFNSILFILLLVSVFVYTVGYASSRFQLAINKYQSYAVTRVISTGIGWSIAAGLAHRFGLVGIVSGFIISELIVDFIVIPYTTLRLIKEPAHRYLGMLGVGAVLFVLQVFWAHKVSFLTSNHLTHMVLSAVVTAIIGSTFTFVLWFNKRERQLFKATCRV